MRRRAYLLSLALLLCGCAGYHVGNTLPTGIATIFVPTVVNSTSEPLLETSLTPALQSELMTRSGLKLAPASRADATLDVRIRDYSLQSVGFVSDDDDESSSSREYRAWITADVVLRNNRTGAIVTEAIGVRGKSTFRINDDNAQGDITGAKRSSLPNVCADLAREIADAVTETWQ